MTNVDHVRECWAHVGNRRRYIKYYGAGRTVGYSTLGPEADSDEHRRFWRRMFWLHPGDRADNPYGTYVTWTPMEAVDPRTVAPGVPGRKTERSLIPRGSPRWRQVMRECATAKWGEISMRAARQNAAMADDLSDVEVLEVDDKWITLGCRDAATAKRLAEVSNLELLQEALAKHAWRWGIRFVLPGDERPPSG